MTSLLSSPPAEIMPAAAAMELLKRRKARRELLPFCKYTSPDYLTPPHLVALSESLERVERGELKRLMVIMPPRHGKSELISLRFPCYYMGRHPKDYIVQAGYADSIALTHSRNAREIFISPRMRALFPLVVARDRASTEASVTVRQAAHEWGTVQGGSYYAVGIGGGLTGRGFNIGIIDDPVKDAEEAESATYRERAWNWYTQVFYTRQAPEAAIIIVMTRWHQDDLVGRLLTLSSKDKSADQWEVLHFPAITDGQALWPERYPIDALMRIKSGQADNPEEPGQGSRAFESLYQGNPTIAEGQIIKREWWRFYDAKPQFVGKVQSWDTAFKDKEQNDYSVCTTWGVTTTGYYLIDVWRHKVEFPELKRAAEMLYHRDLPDAVLVEDAASGQSLAQELERNTKIPILRIKVDKNKLARVNAATPLIESGRVYLPSQAPWLADYVEEMAAFPNGAHDDQVDSSTQALDYLRNPQALQPGIVIYDAMQEIESMDLVI